ncbi:unnamed protein product [Closterium sp. Naga37s-1]|nr:unnamed protein product [Closterium sp. Naga37s-1]
MSTRMVRRLLEQQQREAESVKLKAASGAERAEAAEGGGGRAEEGDREEGEEREDEEEEEEEEEDEVDSKLIAAARNAFDLLDMDVPRPLLAVETRLLRADDELKRIFGSKVIRQVERQAGGGEGGAGGAGGAGGGMGVRGGVRGRRGGGGGGGGSVGRRALLVQEREHWPPGAVAEKGLTMEFVCERKGAGTAAAPAAAAAAAAAATSSAAAASDAAGGVGGGVSAAFPALPVRVFRYVRSATYRAAQHLFEQTVASHDPNQLGLFVAHHPYHVEGLLALSEVYKQVGGMMRLYGVMPLRGGDCLSS